MLSSNRPPLTAFTDWHKAVDSGDDGACVEVATGPSGWRAVRDTTDRSGPVLMFTPREWEAFISGVRKGEFDA